MKKGLRMFLLTGIAASLAVTVPFGLAACDDPENNPCADGTHVDSNGDGICDKCETAMPDPNACPNGGTHVDTNNDGKCDKCGGAYSGGTTVIPIENYRFTVTVTSLGGFGLKDVYVTLKDASGKETRASTNADGVAGFMLDPAAYTVTLSNLPAGYHCEESYTSGASNKNFTIRLESSVILGTAPQGTRYRVGDVLYDFTYTVDDETYQLSELLQENRAVFLNFWATWCGPCMSEFPYLNAAYRGWQTKVETDEAFKERGMEMLAISSYDGATAVAQTKASRGLVFPMMSDSVGITSMVSFSGSIPTTVVIDRYGVCAYIHSGSITSEKDWTDLFEQYTADDYVPPEPDPNPEPNPDPTPQRVEPDIPNPAVEDIAAAATAEGSEFTYFWEDKEKDKYAWPWLVSEDGKSVYPGNTLHPYSYAIMYFDVTITEEDIANKRTAVAFDFHAETEAGRDILYVVTDRKFARTITGISQEEWEICYAHVFDTPGTHNIGLLYQKDTSNDVGSDRVTIKNIRLVKETEVEHAFYVQRDVATGERDATTGVYAKYETVVLNQEDGYYHVGSVNGPLLLANLTGRTQYSEDNSFWNYVYLGQLIVDIGDGLKDYSEVGEYFANRAQASDIEGCFPVTELLQKLMNALAAKHATESEKAVNPKAWLEFCCYYAPYGTEEQVSDPTLAITTHSAIEIVLDDPETTAVESNTVNVYKMLNPRGFYYYFVPEVSGVYTFQSFGDRYVYGEKVDMQGMETFAWIEEEDGNFVQPKELMIVNDMNAQNDVEYDFILSIYLTAGHRYYLRTTFSNSENVGTYNFKVTYDGEEKDVWYHASVGFYTTTVDEEGNATGDIYLPSIEYIYDKNEDRFYQKKANGEKGGMIYIDFGNGTYYTADQALQYLVDIDNMTHMVTENGPLVAPTFDFIHYTSGSFQIEDFANDGQIITVPGKDYTQKMQDYRDQAMATVSTATDPNLKGCIPATAELVNILQIYTTFYGIGVFMPNTWLMLAYYYQHIGPTE
ncbi:MAG: redoxin family protein [Clostridiales bacterium]|nr:redoxin family protein [Clostridiales bacterium]